MEDRNRVTRRRDSVRWSKVGVGWFLMITTIAVLLYALLVHDSFDPGFAVLIFFAALLGGVGGKLAFWTE